MLASQRSVVGPLQPRSSPVPPLPARAPLRRCWKVCASSQGSPGSSQGTSAVDETLKKAGTAFSKASDWAQDAAQRQWRKLDAEYALKDKAEWAAKRVEEKARDVDQQYNVRRRIRNSADHVQRMWPVWSKKLDAFSQTWYGKVTILTVIFVIISSPIFWQLLNLLLLAWWLAIPLGATLVNNAQRRAAERAQAEAEERARQQNPFADMFRSRASAGGAGSRGRSYEQSGPVIDADFVVIDENNKNKK